jgi:predicted amidohydrolase
MQAKDPEFMEDRIFNISFIINPKGEIILKHHKTACATVEPMTEPIDVWDRYIEKYGDDPVELSKAIWPVAHTEIGNIGTLICNEGSFPEAGRALALNGAEIIYRTEYVEPMLSNGMFEVQNKSIAVANTCYVLTPHLSEIYGYKSADPNAVIPSEFKISWGHSRMYDYRGNTVSQCVGTGQSFVSQIINIDGLREYRVSFAFNNYIKDMRVEPYHIIYDALVKRGGIYPKNICMQEPPMTEADREQIVLYGVNRAVELGIYTPPADWKPYQIKKEVLERIRKSSEEIKRRS